MYLTVTVAFDRSKMTVLPIKTCAKHRKENTLYVLPRTGRRLNVPSSGQSPQFSDHRVVACCAQINRFDKVCTSMDWYVQCTGMGSSSSAWVMYQLGCGPTGAWARRRSQAPICWTYWRTWYQYISVRTSIYSIYCSMYWNVSFLYLLVPFSGRIAYILWWAALYCLVQV